MLSVEAAAGKKNQVWLVEHFTMDARRSFFSMRPSRALSLLCSLCERVSRECDWESVSRVTSRLTSQLNSAAQNIKPKLVIFCTDLAHVFGVICSTANRHQWVVLGFALVLLGFNLFGGTVLRLSERESCSCEMEKVRHAGRVLW